MTSEGELFVAVAFCLWFAAMVVILLSYGFDGDCDLYGRRFV